MASSLPQFYADFTFSGETSSQFHGSSSYPDVSALSNYFDNGNSSFNTSSNPVSTFLPQVFGASDVPMPEHNYYYQKMDVNNATQYFHGGDQEYYGFSPEIKPFGEQSWGNNEGGIQAESNTKVGRYTVEERKDRIMRYLKKKNQRNFNKTIKTHNNNSEKEEEMFSGSDDYLIQQMENDDGWLHEAMSNLISFPCELDSPGDDHHPNTWSF
ncbi:hypothetical protein Bca4012_085324 [Brassica carinata]